MIFKKKKEMMFTLMSPLLADDVFSPSAHQGHDVGEEAEQRGRVK